MLPDFATLALFIPASFLLVITPGPDMSFFVGKTLTHSRAAGIAALTGTSTGLVFHTTAAAIGLSALLAASATAFTILKIVGCLYLLYLAADVLRSGSALSTDGEKSREETVLSVFSKGVWVNILNPKIIIFFITFLPQFVSASDPHATQKLFALGLLYILITFPICLMMILGAEQLADTLKSSPRLSRAIDYCFAGVMGAFAIRLLTAQGR